MGTSALEKPSPPRIEAERPIENGIVLRICRGISCAPAAEALEREARRAIEAGGLGGEIAVAHESCFGHCFAGPNVLIERWRNGQPNEQARLSLIMQIDHPDMCFEHGVTPDAMRGIIRRHLRAWRRARGEKDGS